MAIELSGCVIRLRLTIRDLLWRTLVVVGG